MPAFEKVGGTKFSIIPGATTINRHNLLKDGTTHIAMYTALDALFALIAEAQGAKSRETLDRMEKAMIKVGVMREPAA